MESKKLYLLEYSYYTGRPVKIEWLDKSRCCNVIYCNVIELNDNYFEVVYLKYQSEIGWKALTETIPFSDVVAVEY